MTTLFDILIELRTLIRTIQKGFSCLERIEKQNKEILELLKGDNDV